MSLTGNLKRECCKVGTRADDKNGLLKEIAEIASSSPVIGADKSDEVYKNLYEREKLGSTGFGNNIAIPHCSVDGIDDFVVGLIVIPEGIEFDSLDNKPVKLVVFIIGPGDKRNTHIRLLSGVSRILNRRDAVNEIISEKNSEALYESFIRQAVDDIETGKSTPRSIFHVFVQKEEFFKDFLQIFSEVEGSFVSVADVNDASYFLEKMPLFAGFFNDEKHGFHRLIIAVVIKGYSNEVLRRMGDITGGLERAEGVMVTVQNIDYCAGNLNF